MGRQGVLFHSLMLHLQLTTLVQCGGVFLTTDDDDIEVRSSCGSQSEDNPVQLLELSEVK